MAEGRTVDAAWADLGQRTLERCLAAGASEARVQLTRARTVELEAREGKLDKLQEATLQSLELELYVDGRYSSHSTSDLRPDVLAPFVDEAVESTRHLAPDPHRGLPAKHLCLPYPALDLDLEDPAIEALTPRERREQVLALEAEARAAGGTALVTASASSSDRTAEHYLIQSNGATGYERGTSAYAGCVVSVQAPGGERPRGWWAAHTRRLDELPAAKTLAKEAGRRARQQVGASPAPTARTDVLVEARAAGTLLRHLQRALDGRAIHLERSFLAKRWNETVGAALLDISDRPLRPRGLGSQRFDEEGMAARALPLIEDGVFRNAYLSTTYARKLGRGATTARATNFVVRPGDLGLQELLEQLGEGLLVTSFLGGNANSTTGDFSLGVRGMLVRGGQLAGPIAGSNLSGNLIELMGSLLAVGSDVYPWASLVTPSLLFEGVQVSGT